MAAIGKLFGGLAGRKTGTIEYGALNELDVYKRQTMYKRGLPIARRVPLFFFD